MGSGNRIIWDVDFITLKRSKNSFKNCISLEIVLCVGAGAASQMNAQYRVIRKPTDRIGQRRAILRRNDYAAFRDDRAELSARVTGRDHRAPARQHSR